MVPGLDMSLPALPLEALARVFSRNRIEIVAGLVTGGRQYSNEHRLEEIL